MPISIEYAKENDLSLFDGYYRSDGSLKETLINKGDIIKWASEREGRKFNPSSNSQAKIESYTENSVNLILASGIIKRVSYNEINSSDKIHIYWLSKNMIPVSTTDYRDPPSDAKLVPVNNDYYAPRIAQQVRSEQDSSITFIYSEEIIPGVKYHEGSTKKITVNSYERNEKARKICIRYYGAICKICNFNFEQNYGTVGKGYIHVHHLTPLSEITNEYEVNSIEDLRPVCPNCHAMLHKKNPPYTMEELREIINRYQKR